MVDAGGTILYTSPAVERLLGYPRDALTGQSAFDLIHPDDVARARAFLTEQAAVPGVAPPIDVRFRHGDGTWRTLEVIGTNLLREPEVGAFLLNARDVTDWEAARDLLRRSEERYRAFVTHSTEGIWRFEVDPPVPTDLAVAEQVRRFYVGGRLAECNDALARMYGLERAEELIGARLGDFLPESDSANVAYLSAFVTNGYQLSDAETAETDVNGRLHYFSNSLIGVIEDGAVVRTWGLQRDVTAHRELELQLRHSQKLEAVGQLTSGIAHDFNNLLTVILTHAQLVEALLPDADPELRQDLAEIRRAARRGSEMVRKLLAFGRREMLALRPLDLAQAVRDTMETLRRVLPEHIEIVVEAGDDPCIVQADETALGQILMNLATNARDAMPDGGRITLGVRQEHPARDLLAQHDAVPGPYGVLTVRDTGSGMDEPTRERAFEPFFTTKPVERGAGLGLPMIYGLVRQHGGFVELASRRGRGTTVTVHLPLAVDAEDAARESSGPHRAPGGTETIFVVEDEDGIRLAARRVLERAGYRVLDAPNGAIALERIRAATEPIHLIVTDVVMPRLGGPAMLERLRAEGRDIPVLFTSGHTGRDRGGPRRLDPGVPFLPKPWSAQELLLHVRTVLGPAVGRRGP